MARQLDGDAATLRARLQAAAASLRNKDKEVEKAGRAAEAARTAEYDAVSNKLQV
jgi:hypothetical protein